MYNTFFVINNFFQLKEQFNLSIMKGYVHFMLLHDKCTLVWEGSGYPRNRTPMGVSILALAHLTITSTKQFIAILDFFSCMIYNAMLPYGSYRVPPLMG